MCLSRRYRCFICKRILSEHTEIEPKRCDFFNDQREQNILVTDPGCLFPLVTIDMTFCHKEPCTPAGFSSIPGGPLPYLPPFSLPAQLAPLNLDAMSSNVTLAQPQVRDTMEMDVTPMQNENLGPILVDYQAADPQCSEAMKLDSNEPEVNKADDTASDLKQPKVLPSFSVNKVFR